MDEETKEVTKLEGVPLWLFILFSALSLIGVIYASIILIFNIIKAKNKVVKMTSPNINIVILIAVIIGYGSIVMGGVDTGLVTEGTMEKLQRILTFVIPICFTVIYGALFAKAWRVFLVFKNLNFNGKLTRDEHLLIGVLVMVALDLAILLPWLFVDPVQCHRSTIKTKDTSNTEITYEIDECRSDLQELWISLLYVYKLVLVIAGLYFTWQTRHVTLPSLRDSKKTYVVILCVVSCAFIALPSLFVPNVGMRIRFATGGLVIWIALTTTLALLFMPKIFLERKTRATSENASAFNFLFSESMRKTQDAIRKCSLCFCCQATEADKYGQEMLANEIETLKHTIKQKDATIRELNDRLYIGTEKFQEYLTSPMKQNRSTLQAMQEKHLARARANEGVSNTFWPNRDVVQITELPRNGVAVSPKHDVGIEDEGIHSGDSYQQNSAEQSPNSYHSPQINRHHGLPSDAIHTVSNGHVGEHYDTPATGRSYANSRQSSYSSQLSMPSFRDQYNGKPWRPPSPDGDEYQPTINHPQVFHDQPQQFQNHSNGLQNQKTYDFERQNYHDPNRDPSYNASTWSQHGGENVYRHSEHSLQGMCDEKEYSKEDAHSQQFAQIDLGAMENDAIVHMTKMPPSGGLHHLTHSGTGNGMPRDFTFQTPVSNSLQMMSSQI